MESVKKSCQHIQTLIKELNSKSVVLKKMKKVRTLIFIRNESIKKKSWRNECLTENEKSVIKFTLFSTVLLFSSVI